MFLFYQCKFLVPLKYHFLKIVISTFSIHVVSSKGVVLKIITHPTSNYLLFIFYRQFLQDKRGPTICGLVVESIQVD